MFSCDALPPGPDPLLHRGGVPVLTAVTHQRLDLAVELVGDVDHVLPFGPERNPDLVDRPVVQVDDRAPGECERVAGVRIDGGHRRLAGRDVIRVRAVRRVQVPHRQLGDDHLRAHLSDDHADVVTKVQVGDHRAVHVPQEPQVGDPHLRGGLGLFPPPDACHLVTRDRVIEPSSLTVGDEAVHDLHTGIGEVGNGSRRAEVDVVGMGHHSEDPLDLVRLQHRISLPVR